MTVCARCHRALHRAPIYLSGAAYGPRCATAVAGTKPRRSSIFTRLRTADARQRDLFSEATP
jgi:hypothetical protein